jgi:hypothetical protein
MLQTATQYQTYGAVQVGEPTELLLLCKRPKESSPVVLHSELQDELLLLTPILTYPSKLLVNSQLVPTGLERSIQEA